MILQDHSGILDEVVDFIYAFTNEYDTKRLGSIELKVSHGRCYYSGDCTYPPKKTRNKPYHIICRISKHNTLSDRFPLTVKENIGSETYDIQGNPTNPVRGWSYLTEEVTFYDQNEVMVFIFGHEFWHFLCKTKQKSGNWETKANKFGIEVLDQYRQWRAGLGANRIAGGG